MVMFQKAISIILALFSLFFTVLGSLQSAFQKATDTQTPVPASETAPVSATVKILKINKHGTLILDISFDEMYALGIEAGDIIIAFDGEKVSSATDLTLDIREHNPGDNVTITVNRNGEEKSFDVTLGSDEQELAAVSAQSQQSGTEQQNPYGGNGNSSNRGYEGYSYEDLLHFLDLL